MQKIKGGLENFGFYRKSGILIPIASLPSPYGVGSFGQPFFKFINFLRKTKQKCMQVLPLNPTSFGDSPYQSPSSFAGNPYFIDLDILVKKGLLDKEQIKTNLFDGDRIDYGWLFNNRYPLLKSAFSRFKQDSVYKKFIKSNQNWIEDYALFMALKVKYNYAPWSTWDTEYKFYDKAKLKISLFYEEMNFWKWVQFEFYDQWQKAKAYANKNGILIIGDMPIYVAYDSVDVWSNTSEYLLTEDLSPKLVAGVPPDGFCEDGQLWGNPIYDYQKMKSNGFKWWIDRVNHNKKLYDIVRIDHFRGFAGYYVVPATDTNAKNGWWEKGVGLELFTAIKEKCTGARIIAEDLGHITDDVKELLDFTGFPGMKILQFAFYEDNSEYYPSNYQTDNCIVYTGSHDSESTVEWANNLSGDALERFNRLTKRYGRQSRTSSLISLALRSKANLVIIPLQDYMELGKDSRINVPSTSQGNWTWRLDKNYDTPNLVRRIKNASIKANRI
mgnify:CR=1 FL=1